MRISTRCSLLVFICFINLLCKKPETENQSVAPYLNADKKNITTTALAGKDTLTINSSTDWSVINLPSWTNASVMNGSKGSTVIIIQFSANESIKDRAGDINIKSSDNSLGLVTVHFAQSGASEFISIDKTDLKEDAAGQLDSIMVTSNCNWSFVPPSMESGIVADKTSGDAGSTKIRFTIAANNSAQSKSTDIKLIYSNGSATSASVHLSQDINYKLIGFAPTVAGIGDTISLNGLFNSGSIVFLNNQQLQIVFNSYTQIKVVLPSGVSTGYLTVKTNGKDFISSTPLIISKNSGWTKISSFTLPGNSPHQYGISFVYDNKIYYGLGFGITDNIYSSSFDVYDPQTNLWSKNISIASGMHSSKYASCFMLNNIVYMGSGAFNNTSDWWSYDPSKAGDNAWKQIASFYDHDYGGVAFNVNNKAYAGIPFKDGSLFQFNPDINNGTGAWVKLNGLTFPAVHYSSQVVINNKVYIIGGQTKTGDSTSNCWEFDPLALTVKQMSNAPAKFRFAASFNLNGNGYILANGSVYEFDPILNSWTTINTSPVFYGVYNAAVINGIAYAWTLSGDVYRLKL